MDRRSFLKLTAFATGAMCLDLTAFAEQVKVFGESRLKMGILSDIHICNQATEDMFRHALEYFRDQNVDGVIIAGDMADNGLVSELAQVSRAWYTVFPKDRLPDGTHVEKVFVFGNHDTAGCLSGDPDPKASGRIYADYAKYWKKYFKEDYGQVYIKNVKGYKFVCSHWSFDRHGQECGAPEFVAAHADELKGEKPFFYIQHAHLAHTCNGEWAWGQDDGTMTETLRKFPNAIAFSGHSHDPLTDDRDLWQEEFTSIGTSSLRYVLPIGGRENSWLDGETRKIPSQMPSVDVGSGHQGMVMTVYDSYITLQRREFLYDESLGDDWVIPIPKGKDAPLSFGSRAETAPVPQFASDAKIAVGPFLMGRDRHGEGTIQLELTFPSVLKKTTGVRAFDYEVSVEQRYVDMTTTACTKHVYSPHCFLGEDHDEEDVKCVFAKRELPPMFEYRFAVRPCNCFGRKGRAIYSEWQKSLDQK